MRIDPKGPHLNFLGRPNLLEKYNNHIDVIVITPISQQEH
jgi:hypothetical protein